MRTLDSRRKGGNETERLVIFLHGYGADGNDLLGLSDPLAPHMPGTTFVAPNAPEICATNPGGFQWFPIPWIDGSSEEAAETSMMQSVQDLNAFIDTTMEEEGVTAAETVLFSFSQGTMMSLHIAPRRAEPFAGIVGFSGRLLQPESLADEVVSRPPVLLAHGDQDDLVPVQSMPEAGNALTEAGFQVYAHVMEGTGHGIAPDGLSVAAAFMRDVLQLE